MFNLTAALNVIAPNRNVKAAVDDIEKSLNRAEKSATRFSDAIAMKGRGFVAYSVASAVVVKLSESIAQATRDALRFEAELAKIAQTVGKSNNAVKFYSNQIRQIGINYGFSTVKIAETVRVLAQAGFSFRDSAMMAEELAKTTLLSSFESIADTTDGLIAIFKQFNISAGETDKVLSSLNVVAKKYAVESGDLVEAVRKVGGVFATTGGTLDELLAVFTTVRDTTRESAETIATGLRTIFARIQRPKTIEFMRQFGVELTDLKGNFVGNYEAIRRIQEGLKAGNIQAGSIQFASIIEELGGVRQISRTIPLLTQSEKLQEVLNASRNSASETAADIARAQDTLSFKLSKLQQQFANFVYDLTQSSTFKKTVDLMLRLAEAAIKTADAFKELIPLVGAITAFNVGKSLFRSARVGRGFFFNKGGQVPGSGDRDTVKAMLTPGEFVINKKAAQAIGYDNLFEMNAQHLNKGGVVGVQKFAAGGVVQQDIGEKGISLVESLAPIIIPAVILGKIFTKVSDVGNRYAIEREKEIKLSAKIQAEMAKNSAAIREETNRRTDAIGSVRARLDEPERLRTQEARFRAQADVTANRRDKAILIQRANRTRNMAVARDLELNAPDPRDQSRTVRQGLERRVEDLASRPTVRERFYTKQNEILQGVGKDGLRTRLSQNSGNIVAGGVALTAGLGTSIFSNLANQRSIELEDAVSRGNVEEAKKLLAQKTKASQGATSIGTLAAGGAAVGSVVGSVVPVFGTLAGSVVGGAAGGAIGVAIGALIGTFDSLNSAAKGVADFFLGWGGFETFAQAEAKAEKEIVDLAKENKKAREEAEAQIKAAAAIATTQAQINSKLIRTFTALDAAASKATSIGKLADLVGNLGSQNFRSTALSSSLNNGSARAFRSAGSITGAAGASARLVELSNSRGQFQKALDAFKRSNGNASSVEALQKAAEIAAATAGGDAPKLAGASFEDIQAFADELKNAEEKMRDSLVNTATSLEQSFNKYIDSISVAANAQTDYNQALIDASQAERERRKEFESFSTRGTRLSDIRDRQSEFGPFNSSTLRANVVGNASQLNALGVGITRLQSSGLGDSDAARRLQGDFSVLQIATQQQIALLKQDTQVRQQLIETLKEELQIEKARAEAFTDVAGALSGLYGSDRQDQARETAREASLVQQAFATGGVSGATRQIGRAVDNGQNAEQLMQLLPTAVSEAIQQSAISSGARTAANMTGGQLGADFRSVGRTGFTTQGLTVAKNVMEQNDQQTENQAALLRAQQENLQMLTDSSRILGESVNAIAGHFTNFSNELRGIVDSIKGASISMTMQPTNVVVTLNNAESLELISRQMKSMVMETVAQQLIAQQQGRI